MADLTRYRLKRKQRVWLLVLSSSILLSALGSLLTRHHVSGLAVAFFLAEVVVYVGLYALQGRSGVDLEEHSALLRGVRLRRVPWDQVTAIQVEDRLGTTNIVLVGVGGRTRLRAPITGFLFRDKDFERSVEAIRSWWLTHRSPDAVPITDLAISPPQPTI